MMDLKTNDPLGIGGLLADATRTTQLMVSGTVKLPELLDKILRSTVTGIRSYIETGQLSLSPDYRLAFRELGLAIGLKGLKIMEICIKDHPELFTPTHEHLFKQIKIYQNISQDIDNFW